MLCERPGDKVHKMLVQEGSELDPGTQVKNLSVVVFTCNPSIREGGKYLGFVGLPGQSNHIGVFQVQKKKKRTLFENTGWSTGWREAGKMAQKAKALAAKPDNLSLIPDPSDFHIVIFLSQPHTQSMNFLM